MRKYIFILLLIFIVISQVVSNKLLFLVFDINLISSLMILGVGCMYMYFVSLKIDYLVKIHNLMFNLSVVISLLQVITMVFISYAFVSGPSMQPNYNNNDFVLISYGKKISRFDVVAVKHPNSNQLMIKRVIALSGDQLLYENGKLYLNGELLNEQFQTKGQFCIDTCSFTVENGAYFVVGDNRNNSIDSRDFGSIKYESIIGRVII